MASINPQANPIRRKAGVKPIAKLLPRVDMTPMVDLGFLLITFFIFTTQLSNPASLKLRMPADGPPTNLAESKSMTVIIGEDDVQYYFGEWDQALYQGRIHKTNLHVKDGLGKIIRDKRQEIEAGFGKQAREEFMLLIKPADESNYQQLVDVLDEVLINDLKKYAIITLTSEEKEYLSQQEH